VQILDEEVRRLPVAYRLPVVLCCLEGLSQEEAAARLRWTPGSVKGRLERGRARLHARLVKRGLVPSAALAAEMARGTPAAPASITARAVLAGTARGAGGVTARAAAWAETALRGAVPAKLRLALALVLALGAAVGGAVGLMHTNPPTGSSAAPGQVAPVFGAAPGPEKEQARTDLYGDPLPRGALVRLGTLRWRTGAGVEALAFSSDGKLLAAETKRGVWLFDTATGKRKPFRPGGSSVAQIAFSPDGRRLAFTCTPEGARPGKRVVRIWDLAGGRKVREADADKLRWLGWSADGRPLAVYLGKDAVLLRELATGKERRLGVEHLPPAVRGLSACAYAARGNVLAVPDARGVIHVWDAATGVKRCALRTKGGYVAGLAVSPDGRSLASITIEQAGCIVQLWDVAAGRATHTLTPHQLYFYTALFSPDGKTLATVSYWYEIRFWDVASGRELRRTRGGLSLGKAAAFSPDGKTLATAAKEGQAIHLWDVATAALRPQPPGHAHGPSHVTFSADGWRVATGGQDGAVLVWDLATGRRLAAVRRPFRWDRGHAFSADGRSLFSGWDDDQVHVSDAATGRTWHVLKMEDPDRPETRQSGMDLFLSDDRRTLVAVSYYYPRREGEGMTGEMLLTGWDAATRKQLFRRRRAAPFSWVAVTADARVLAADGRGGGPGPGWGPLRIEVLATGERLLDLAAPEGQKWPALFSPDGRLLAAHHSGPPLRPGPGGGPELPSCTLRVWELATAKELLALPEELNSRAAFSPDGRVLALSAAMHEIALWDLGSGKELRRFKGLGAQVTSLAFSPDGGRLISGLSDSTLLVWDVSAVREAARPVGLDAAGAARAWADLGADARKAFAARRALAWSPDRALPLLRERLKPAPAPDAERLRRLLADLGSARFAVREQARKDLEEVGAPAEPALRQALKRKPPLEVERRIQGLLDRLRGPVTRPDTVRAVRAVAVLEDVGTPEARRLLRAVAAGARGARLTQEAQASLERLARRPAPKP
jgi:WD40 repeat protein